jgi:membrane protein
MSRAAASQGKARRHSGWSLLTGLALLGARHAMRSAQRPTKRHDLQSGRGRSAEKPSDIPAPGWKDIFTRVYGRLGEDRILVIAAGITFYCLLALFPAIAALISLYGMFADPRTIAKTLDSLGTMLPGGAIEVVRNQIDLLTSHGSGTLGIATLIGLAVALWSANAGMKALYDGLNVAYREREKRSFVTLNVSSLSFTICMIGFALLALAAIVVLPYLVQSMPFGEFGQWAVTIGKWPVLLVLVIFVFACLYRFGPSRDAPQWRWITWGSAVAAIVWLIASILFSWYAGHFGSYNKTYGSLGAVIGFMTWMWISATVFILGGVLNAELEHQTTKDTTKGRPQPMGSRRAYVADTVGK